MASLTANGQSDYEELYEQYKTWIAVKPGKNVVNFSGHFRNYSPNVLTLTYELSMERNGVAGQTYSVQGGAEIISPDSIRQLGNMSINLQYKDYYKVVVKVYEQLELIAADSIVNKKLNFLKSRPKPSAKPTPKKKPKLAQKVKPKIQKPPSNPTPIPKAEKKPAVVTAPPATKTIIARDAIELDGLILDETRSKTARDFYDQFYAKWNPPPEAKDYLITIQELPSRGRASRIAIKVNDNEIVQRTLQPRLEIIELLAEQSIRMVTNFLTKEEKLKTEMGNEDTQGSGIY